MKKTGQAFILSILFVLPVSAQVTSALWGVSGEAWNPTNSLLSDFSSVGYSNGLVAIPDWPVGVNVTNFGAVADDDLDDSQAFIDAIAACPSNHAVFVPKGRYVIEQLIKPQRDHFVLRGEDMYEAVLFFPKHLNEVYPNQKGWYPPDPEGGDGVRTRGLPKGFFRVEGGTERSIENLSFEFREERKMGHWENKGACAIGYADGVEHSWIRNIYVKNGDNSIMLERSSQLSVLNIILNHYIGRPDADYGKRRFVTHEGIGLHGTSHSLIHNARMYGRYMHAIDNNQVPAYNAISQIRVDAGAMQHHGGGSTHNLYTDMNMHVTCLSDSGGQNHEVHWNVAAEVTDDMYNSTKNNLFVGYGDGRAEKITTNIWYEPLDPAQLTPSNIYLAQLEYFGKPLPEGPPPPVPSPYEGEVIRINPTDDHYLTSDPTDGPDDIEIPVGSAPFFKFDLTGIPMTHVAHVRFRLNLSSMGTLPYELSAWMVTDDNWSEATLSPEDHPEAVSELDAVQLEVGRLSHRVEFDVTPFVQNEISNGDPVITLCVKASGAGQAKFYSSENGLAPELVIEQVDSSVPGAPNAPTGLRSTALIGNIILDWDDNPEADVATYKVYRSDSYTGTGLVGAGLVTSDFVDTRSGVGFAVGMMDHRKLYTYWVTAVDEHGYESPRSLPFVAATLPRTNAPPWDPTDIPTNEPPAFAGAVSLTNATARSAYSDSLATEASDPDADPLYFFKVSGPDWLSVAQDGTLSGMPDVSDAGTNTFTFQVTALGGSTQNVVNIRVDLPADSPPGAPAAPTGLGSAAGNSSVSLSWDSNTEADLYGYNLYRSTTSGSYGSALALVVGTNATVDSPVSNGTTYYYKITAVDHADNESAMSSEISVVPVDADPAPTAPTGLTATAGDYFVDLAWDANPENDLAGYTIYRSGLSGIYYGDPVASNVTENNYRDHTAMNGLTYYYVVTATDSGGHESPVSNEDSATPSDIDPEPPVGLSAIARDGEVFLLWDNSTDVDFSSYSVYRSTTSGSYGSALQAGITNNTWSDDTAVNGTPYYYTVTAVDASAQESGPGNEASATPQAGLLTTLFLGDVVSGAANNWINNSTNWDAGLPVSGSQGLITIDAKYESRTTLEGYDVVQRAGFVSNDGINKLQLSGSVWLLDGSTASIASRGTIVDTSQFTLNNGEANFSGNNKDTIVQGSGSSITLNGGLMTIGQNLVVQNGGTFTMNAGTLTGAGLISLGSSSSLAFNGGATTADRFNSDATRTATFGGTTEGSLTLLTGLGTVPTLNWLPDTHMSMTVASSNEWAEVLWDADLLTYNGQDKTALGKTWAQVTASDGLGAGYRFAYDSNTETLTLTAEVDTTAPAAPTGLTAVGGDGSVTLNWNDNGEGDLAGYSVYRSTTSGSYGAALTNGLSASTYVDNTAANGTSYYYVVTASDSSSNESAQSNEDSATPAPDSTPPAAPTGLGATAGDKTVTLDWNDNGEVDLVSYSVYRSTTSGSYGAAQTNGLSRSDYVDNSALNGTTYYYVVTATDTSRNESLKSSEASAVPAEPSFNTVWTGSVSTDLNTAGNWDNGLPDSSGNFGTINTGAGTLNGNPGGLFVIQNGGTFVTSGGNSGRRFMGSGSWTVGFGATFNMDANGDSDGVTQGRLFIQTGQAFNIEGGTVTNVEKFRLGSSGTGSTFLMTGGSFDMSKFEFLSDSVATIGGTDPGTITAGSISWESTATLDWRTGTKIAMESSGSWAESAWANDRLLYNGQSSTDLSVSWADATNSATGLGDGAYFVFNTNTLSLASSALNGYDQWAAGWSNSIGAATNDFDSDGVNNLYEYAMDGNPTNGLAPTNLPVFSRFGNGFLYVHPQRSDDTNLIYTVETTTNLMDSGAWTNEGYTVTGTNITGGTLDFFTNDVDTAQDEKFIRLRIGQ